MSYHVVVLVKQVPDTKRITGEAMRDDGTVNRSALPAIFNPEDLNALEAALRLREQHGGRVTVLTMGPPQAADILRAAMERGADEAILLTDRRAAASDTLATSYILARAVSRIGRETPVDMVLCGRQAIDGRNTGDGYERVEAPLPCLLTVTDQGPEPRPASAKRIMAAKKYRAPAELEMEMRAEMPEADAEARGREARRRAEALAGRGRLITQWNLDDIDADLAWCGRDGSPTKVKRIQSVVLAGSGFKKVEPTEEGVAGMIHELIEDHTIG